MLVSVFGTFRTRTVLQSLFSDGKIIADDKCYNILTDPDIISRASLKETSLYELAGICGIEDGTDFVKHFIEYERGHRSGAAG